MYFARCIISLFCLSLFSANVLASSLNIKKTINGIRYVTGGISIEEVDKLKSMSKQFSLSLVFSESASGRYAMPVNINVYDEAGNLVFRKVEAQPRLLIDLPAGTYTLLASYNGEKLRHKCTVATNAPQTITLNWKTEIEEERAGKDE